MTPVISLPTLRETLTVGFRHKSLICLALIIPIVASLALAFLLTPEYKAESKILVRVGREYIPHDDNSVASNTIAPSSTMQETIDTEGEILTSADLLKQLLKKITIARLYPDLYDSPPSNMSLQDAALKALREDLTVEPVKLSNVLAIGLRNEDREIAVDALKQLLALFQVRHIAAFSHHRSALLEAQLADNLSRLDTLEKERANFEKTNNLFSVTEERASLIQKREKDAADLQDAELSIAGLNQRVNFLKSQLNQTSPIVTLQSTSQNSSVAEDTQKQLRELLEQREKMLSSYNASSRMLDVVNAALAAVQHFSERSPARSNTVQSGINPIYTNLQMQFFQTGSDLVPLTSKVAVLRTAIADDDAQLSRISNGETILDDFGRRITQLDSAANTLHQQLENARYIEDLDRADIGSLNVIQEPALLPKPVFPKKWLFLAGGLVLGLVLSTLVMLLSLTFGNRFLTVDTIERVLGLPVLVALPDMRQQRLRTVVTLAHRETSRRLTSS